MPPRKRTRVSQPASPSPASETKSPVASSPPAEEEEEEEEEDNDEELLNDPWTDEEEAGLFKGLIQWKPTGIHKHFRLLALHQFLLQNHYIDPRSAHTRPAGIWRKLEKLYDLEVLDEREDARQLSDLTLSDDEEESDEEEDDDIYSEAENKVHNQDFVLPESEYANLKWKRRFADRGADSPPLLPTLNFADIPPFRFTPSFSVEPEVVTPSSRAGRGRQARGKPEPAKGGRRGSTRRSMRNAESVAEESEEQEEEDEGSGENEDEDEEEEEDEEEGGEEDDEEEEEESEGEEENEGTPARSTRNTKSSSKSKARPPAKTRTSTRGTK